MTEPGEASSRLESLIEITQRLIDEREPESLVREVQESVLRLFHAEGCTIALLDPSGGEIVLTAVNGDQFRIGTGVGIAGHSIETGEAVVANDVRENPHFYAGVDQETGFETRSILCAPLRRGGRVIGAIEALNTTRPEGFDAEDLALLQAFGALAATVLERTRAFSRIERENRSLREEVGDRHRLVIGRSKAMREVLEMARAAADARTTVLLLGPSGTGKEVLARAIHEWSPRRDQPFVAVNCVALTPELLESELFGHERGAFTGATSLKKGKFEVAEGGSIFLDEIGDLAPGLQAKLLRVLQEREFQRVGGVRDVRVDVRIVAATNRDLGRAMTEGAFREDLYYRLNVLSLQMPPLAERREDLDDLVATFSERVCRDMNRPTLPIEPEAMEAIRSHDWPGNVRELQNAIERAVVLAQGSSIGLDDLPLEVTGPRPSAAPVHDLDPDLPLSEAVDEFKALRIRRALESSGGNQTKAAELLGMRQSNLSRLMKSLQLK